MAGRFYYNRCERWRQILILRDLRGNPLKGIMMKTNTSLFSRLPGGLKVRSLLALAVILLAAWLIVESPLFHKTAPPACRLTYLHSVRQFQSLFNPDVGTPRLVLTFSPTHPTSLAPA